MTGPPGGLPEDLTELSVADAGAAFRAGVLDPVELTEAYLERIDALDGGIHAYVVVTAERAREDARGPPPSWRPAAIAARSMASPWR